MLAIRINTTYYISNSVTIPATSRVGLATGVPTASDLALRLACKLRPITGQLQLERRFAGYVPRTIHAPCAITLYKTKIISKESRSLWVRICIQNEQHPLPNKAEQVWP